MSKGTVALQNCSVTYFVASCGVCAAGIWQTIMLTWLLLAPAAHACTQSMLPGANGRDSHVHAHPCPFSL